MLDLVELLESFNRKERLFLIKQALGGFQLADEFRKALGNAICPDTEESESFIPEDALVAMDYHLDWIAAALTLNKNAGVSKAFDNAPELVTGTQEDIDLLVAFQKDGINHLVFVEAKGVTSWSNCQMRGKAQRLKNIFGDDGNCYPGVTPHLCLMSRREPSTKPPNKLDTDQWPEWMRSYKFIELGFPEDRKRVTRQGDKFRINSGKGR